MAVSERWGSYKGYEIYKYYGDNVTAFSKGNSHIVYAIGGKLYRNGVVVGTVSKTGEVTDWHPEKGDKPVKAAVSANTSAPVATGEEAESILQLAWSRSIDDLVGDRFE